MKIYDLIIVGGGASGMLCAIEAKKLGVKDILLIEKDNVLGGALSLGNYNISNELKITGKNYKTYLVEEFEKLDIETKLNTMVLKIEEDKEVLCTSSDNGIEKIKGEKIILANGAKEGSKQAVNMVGSRCAGIYTVGMTKKIFSMNMIPGRKILIYGTDTLYMIEKELNKSNVEVVGIISHKDEFDNYGLTKNIYYNYEITDIEGRGRVEKVILRKNDEKLELECDTILFAKAQLSDGLVAMRSGIELNPKTTGPRVDERYMTSKEDVYACGNGIYIHNYIEDIEKECSELIDNIYKQ